MHPMLNVAVKAARRAGAIINRATDDLEGLRAELAQIADLKRQLGV